MIALVSLVVCPAMATELSGLPYAYGEYGYYFNVEDHILIINPPVNNYRNWYHNGANTDKENETITIEQDNAFSAWTIESRGWNQDIPDSAITTINFYSDFITLGYLSGYEIKIPKLWIDTVLFAELKGYGYNMP